MTEQRFVLMPAKEAREKRVIGAFYFEGGIRFDGEQSNDEQRKVYIVDTFARPPRGVAIGETNNLQNIVNILNNKEELISRLNKKEELISRLEAEVRRLEDVADQLAGDGETSTVDIKRNPGIEKVPYSDASDDECQPPEVGHGLDYQVVSTPNPDDI